MMKRRTEIIRILFLLALAIGAAVPGRAEEAPKKIPVKIRADTLNYDRTRDVYVAEGHVRIEQEGMVLEADKVVLDNTTGNSVAEGRVYFRDRGDVLQAEKLEFNVNTRTGVITNGSVYMSKENYHLKGRKIERTAETRYAVEDGILTTCDDDDWYLKARKISVDMDRYATGSGASFYLAGVPVFYSPYILFPVRRQTGLLIPEPGYSSNDGFLIKNAFFWAISDYKDMTLYSDYRDKLGHGTGLEYRYVNSRDSAGRAYYNYFDTKNSTERRWEFQFEHKEEVAEDLSARADINLVSDWRYYQDLERSLAVRSRPYLDSNAFYVERWNTASLTLLGQYSTDLTQPNDKTIQKVPELSYSIFQERLAGPVHVSFDGSAANFTRREGDSVRRADFIPQVTAALSGGGFSFAPRAGFRATFYDRGATSMEPVDRKYSFAGADLNARISRTFGTDRDAGIGRVRHSIEPTISYAYVPRVDQTDIPQLDSADTVTSQNMMTFSLVNRLTARYKDASGSRTFDLMVFKLSRAYDMEQSATQPRKDIIGELVLKTPKLLSVSANAEYNTDLDRRTSSSEGVTFKGDILQLDVTHRYLRDPKTQYLVFNGGLKLGPWSLNTQVSRDLENKRTPQAEYKAHYASQCWGAGVTYRMTAPTETQPRDTSILFMLDLKGVGGMKF